MNAIIAIPASRAWARRARAAATAVALVAASVAATPAHAVDREDQPAPAATIRVDLGVYGGAGGRFRPEEEVAFYAETDRDAWLAVYNIDAGGRVSLLFPRDPAEDAWVEGGRRVRVPERNAGYSLFLGADRGVEFVVAVASDHRIDLERFFPDGEFAALDDIYDDEELDREDLDRDTWVAEDPFLAMDLISAKLVPDYRREEGFGDAYVTLRVGDGGDRYDRAERVEVVRVYHHRYLYEPVWDPFWDPWDRWYTRPAFIRTGWYDPWYGDPWYGTRGYVVVGWYDPFWDPWWGWDRGVSVHAGWYWWDDSWQHHHHHDWDGPSSYWGSRVKWKTLEPPAGGGMPETRWRDGGARMASYAPSVGVKAPPAKVRLSQPLTPGLGERSRDAGTVRSRETAVAPETRRTRERTPAADPPSGGIRARDTGTSTPQRDREAVRAREAREADRSRETTRVRERESTAREERREREREGVAREDPTPRREETRVRERESGTRRDPPAEVRREEPRERSRGAAPRQESGPQRERRGETRDSSQSSQSSKSRGGGSGEGARRER